MIAVQTPIQTSAESAAFVAEVQRGGVEVIDNLADEWRKLCAESSDDQPFFRPEWITAHIRAFTPQAKVVLLTVNCGAKLVFVLPLLQERSSFNGIPVRKLRAPVNSHSCRFDAVRHKSAQGDAAVVEAWNCLQTLSGWDLLEFDDVIEGGTVSRLANIAGNRGVRTAEVPMRRCPYVRIPSDAAELQQFPSNKRLRSQLRGIRRDLAQKGQLKFSRGARTDLGRFYALESAGWKGAEGSAIACNPQTRQFYDEVSEAAELYGYLRMYFLELEGELLASHFGLAHNGRYFSPKIAYNEKFPQYAPGHLMVSEILQDCALHGISEYDITGVSDDWKMKWTSEARAKFRYLVFRGGVRGAVAHAVGFKLKPAVKRMVQSFKKSERTMPFSNSVGVIRNEGTALRKSCPEF